MIWLDRTIRLIRWIDSTFFWGARDRRQFSEKQLPFLKLRKTWLFKNSWSPGRPLADKIAKKIKRV